MSAKKRPANDDAPRVMWTLKKDSTYTHDVEPSVRACKSDPKNVKDI